MVLSWVAFGLQVGGLEGHFGYKLGALGSKLGLHGSKLRVKLLGDLGVILAPRFVILEQLSHLKVQLGAKSRPPDKF